MNFQVHKEDIMNEHKKFSKLLKRLLILCLCLVMALGSAATIFADGFNGDLNNDGQVTSFDAQMLAEYEAGLRELSWTEEVGLTVRGIIDFILGRTANEPNLDEGIEAVIEVKVDENNVVTKDQTITEGNVTATVPAGTKVTGKILKLTVKKTDSAEGEVALDEGQEQLALDIHVDGVAADNTTPIIITVGQALDNGYNQGNLELYHVEDSIANEMEQVNAAASLNEHNSFYYDPATGDFTVAMATFSVVRAVMNTANGWNGNFDYIWYDADAKELTIANADQLAAFGAIVGGMKKVTGINEDGTYTYSDSEKVIQDSFSGQTVKLTADINLADDEENNVANKIFYPIGYWNNEGTYERLPVDERKEAVSSGFYTFNGTFDGQGHTIANFYHNTWEMKGDHNWYDPIKEQYYRDGMGLFGKVYGGTIKNLTVDNFSSDGEIATTGVIAAYADGATFENIAITNCNPRVYNIGNGGIVGCVGWYAKEADLKTTFTNITVDNSNKISALWGSYDVACGGIVGQYYPTSGQSSVNYPVNAGIHFENCHVAAQMDVYNDVCANYQYYAYRYTGMMIGSIRENVTGGDGHVYPKMDGITATGCTVHFGTWNDYYYCELVANSLASYTHDHQFSRLEQVESVDAENMTVTSLKGETTAIPSSGRVNYVVVNGEHATENATCYHFVDGKVHNHDDYNGDGVEDYETVNGESIRVENNRHIYLEFDQLFTGYGWGVTSKGLTDVENYVDENGDKIIDITILDRVAADSVKKFDKATTAKDSYTAGTPVTIGELFAATDAGLAEKTAIKSETVQVFVSPVGESTAGGAYTADTSDWTKGTLTFTGTGAATITITDYNFCTPTTINVTIEDRQPVKKFETKFTGDFLYRVGNDNSTNVALESLFTGTNVTGDVAVTVETISGKASGVYTANATWTKGTINFDGTGVVKVTITDNDYCKPTELYLEVVNAKNITSAAGSTSTSVVLLQDVTFAGSYLYYKDMTLYGNGFTIDITGADHSDLKDSSNTDSNKSAYCNIWMVNSKFDNVQIVGSVYPEVGMTADSDYGNAAIRTEGNCYITNSYISNCRVPLRVQGNTTLENTVVDGGRYANIELRSGALTLNGVTTINTVRKGSDGTTDVIGFGIVIHAEAANASIAVIGDGLKQHNWAGENKHKAALSGDTYLSNAYKLVFNANNNDRIYFKHNDDRYVNTGILCLCEGMEKDVVSGLDDRYYQEVSGYDAWVLTYDNSKHTDWFNESVGVESPTHTPEQDSVIPEYTGDEDQTIEFTKGETYYFDTSVLKAEKFGNPLTISSVVLKGTTYNYGDKIPMTEGGIYEIVYTVEDPYNYSADTIATTVKHTKTITVTAIAKDAEILAPKFTFIDQNGNKYESTTVKAGDKTYVMPNVTAADPTTNSMSSINIGSASISGTTVYFPIAKGHTIRSGSNFNRYYPLFNGINITDYTIAGDTTGTTYTTSGNYTSLVGSSDKKFIIPANGGQASCGDYVKTNGQAGNAAGNSDSGWQGAGYSTSYGGTYLKSGNTNASSGADKNGYERIVWVEYCFNAGNGDVYYYRIGYHCEKVSAQCVTGDTLVMLADGGQKRVDEIKQTDELLVWNFFTGNYDVAPAAIIFYHGDDMFEVLNLTFEDGTVVKTINNHGFFDVASNNWVYIDKNNVEDYIGNEFVKTDSNNYKTVKLTDYSIAEEYTGCYSIQTAQHINFMVEGMFSITFPPYEGWFDYFEIGDNMKYDEAKMQADIEKYGLYTYEDFAEYVTYEQFIAFNGPYLKVLVGRGVVTYEQILDLIAQYVAPLG